MECLKIGAIDFIPKPYPTWEIIQARVHRCIELSEKRNIIQSTEHDSLTNLFTIEYFLRYVRMFDQHYADMKMDAIVLDMSFVRSAFGENRDVRMIELIIDIADYLHVPVVAEGVETEEQYLVLKAMGCDLVQGYYFSRPVPADVFDQFLLKRAETKAELPMKSRKPI